MPLDDCCPPKVRLPKQVYLAIHVLYRHLSGGTEENNNSPDCHFNPEPPECEV
jgi:hypothetical protein